MPEKYESARCGTGEYENFANYKRAKPASHLLAFSKYSRVSINNNERKDDFEQLISFFREYMRKTTTIRRHIFASGDYPSTCRDPLLQPNAYQGQLFTY